MTHEIPFFNRPEQLLRSRHSPIDVEAEVTLLPRPGSRLPADQVFTPRADTALLKSGRRPGMSLAEVGRLIRELQQFAGAFGGAWFFRDWPADTVFRYLAFHWCARQIVIVREAGRLAGYLVMWPADIEQIRQRELVGAPHFDWRIASGGDAYILADVVTAPWARPGGAVRRLEQLATAQWPDWKLRTIYTWRRGRLIELRPAALERFLHGQPPLST